MNNTLYRVLFVLILVVTIILRFYKLGTVPYGFYQDESAIGYNAYSLITTGRDEYGEAYPLYFKSFGDYKLPVYMYVTALSVSLLGLTEFAVRLPSAAFGTLTVVALYFFVKNFTRNRNLALVTMALLAINPWHLHYSRATFEVSIALFFFTFGTVLLHRSCTKQSRGSFIAGTVFFIVSFYTYNLTRLLSPVLYGGILFLYRKKLPLLSKRERIVTAIASVVLLVPFLLTALGSGGTSSAAGTFIFTSAAVQAPLLEFKSYMITLPSMVTRTLFNMRILTLWQFLQNVASYFSVSFFFLTGSSHGNHGIGNSGLFYLFELPLIVVGVGKLVKEKSHFSKLLLLWAASTIAVASLTREAPHATRSFFLIVPMVVASSLGFVAVAQWIGKRQTLLLKAAATLASLCFIGFTVIYYFASYYIRFPVAYAKAWRSADKELSLYLESVEHNYNTIIVDKNAGLIYTSILFFQKFSPDYFRSSVVRAPDDSEGFSEVLAFGKYKFRDIDWARNIDDPNTLIVTTPDRKPGEAPSLRSFTYPKRPVVLSLKQDIMSFPVEEVAYVVVSKAQ